MVAFSTVSTGSGSFSANTIARWRLNKNLVDDVSQNDFAPSTGAAKFKTVKQFDLLTNRTISKNSLSFEIGKSYTVTNTGLDAGSADFTVMFWWDSPKTLGFTRHAITRDLQAKAAPLIAKSSFITSTTRHSLSNASFVISECAYSSTQNAIRVYISTNGVTPSHIIVSEPYLPGLRHVLVTHDKSAGRLRIDIDGKIGIDHSAPTTDFSTTSPFIINDKVPERIPHISTQVGGLMFDLVYTSYAAVGDLLNTAVKTIRYGTDYATISDLFDTGFSYMGFSYTQQNTITTTHIFAEGDNIFAAKSNGQIIKGNRPIWDKEFNYTNQQDVNLLTATKTGNGKIVEWTEEGLRLKGTSVKI